MKNVTRPLSRERLSGSRAPIRRITHACLWSCLSAFGGLLASGIDLAGDTDGDGYRDTLEVNLGTDPFDPASKFAAWVESHDENSITLRWPSAAGIKYWVQYDPDLQSGFSETIAGPFEGASGTLSATIDLPVSGNTESSGDRGFFQVSAEFPPPNVVLIMSDDHVAMAMGNMNHPDHPEVLTPNMDLLASRGLRFDRAYSNTSICRPSRATTFTGLFEYKHVTNFIGPNHLDTPLWGESYPLLMRRAGYRIGFAGKFGFGMELSEATYSGQFDKWGGFNGDGQGDYDTASNNSLVPYAAAYPHVSRALGAFGQDFIEESVAAGERFCLTIFPKAPHLPNTNIDPADLNKFDGVESFVQPTTWAQSFNLLVPDQPRFARPPQRRWTTDAEYQEYALGYYRLIAGLDAGIGMVLEQLEDSGVAHNTVVIYTSDNGYFLGAHGGWHGKVLPHEEGSRIPMIVYDPFASLDTVGTTTNAIVGNVDLAPTLLDYANVTIPSNYDGLSIRSVVENPEERVRDAMLLIQNWSAGNDDLSRALSVVTERYKYTYWPYGDVNVSPAEEIYEIPEDAFETNNLALTLDPAALSELRGYYDGFVQDWKDEVANEVLYSRLGVIFDRSIPFTEKAFRPISRDDYRANYEAVTGQPYPN